VVRAALRAAWGMEVPEDGVLAGGAEALAAAGHGVEAHRAAFAAFLEYLKANLAGQTPHRIDARWTPQHRFVEGFVQTTPLTLVEHEARMVKAAAYLRTAIGQEDIRNAALRNGARTYRFPLAEVYCARIEALTRAASGRDYVAFGFTDWANESES
ncbi:MAG: hypothetical protein AAFQ51_04370, partial [Pseudomonadota bacterium]